MTYAFELLFADEVALDHVQPPLADGYKVREDVFLERDGLKEAGARLSVIGDEHALPVRASDLPKAVILEDEVEMGPHLHDLARPARHPRVIEEARLGQRSVDHGGLFICTSLAGWARRRVGRNILREADMIDWEWRVVLKLVGLKGRSIVSGL